MASALHSSNDAENKIKNAGLIIILRVLMKTDYSKHGLSQIVQETDYQEFQNARQLLAKLNNEELLNQYVPLKAIMSEYKDKHQNLMKPPISTVYKRFGSEDLQRKELARKELAQKMREFELAHKNLLTTQELKLYVSRKLQENNLKEKEKASLTQRRHMFFQMLKTSRSFQSEYYHKEGAVQAKAYKSYIQDDSMQEQKKKKVDVFVEQTIEDVFLRLESLGSQRDLIKKKWYSWGQKCTTAEKKILIQQWDKIHLQTKEVLEQLLEKLTAKVGSSEIFRQLRIQNISILKSHKKSVVQKSMNSTGILGTVSKDQTKMIVKFSQWYNKLLLDQRELEYIHVQNT